MSNVRANLQLSGTHCSNVRNHSPAHAEVLLDGCCSNTSSAENANVKEKRKVMGLTWTKRNSAVSQPGTFIIQLYFCLGITHLRESMLLVFILNGNGEPVQHSSCLGKATQLLLLHPSFKQKKPSCGYKKVIYKNILRIDISKQPFSYCLLFCLWRIMFGKFSFPPGAVLDAALHWLLMGSGRQALA